MQNGMRHLIGATLMVLLCFIGPPTSAQEWSNAPPDAYGEASCPTCNQTGEYAGEYAGEYSGEYAGEYTGQCAGDGPGQRNAGANAAACKGKACFGNRPYTEDSQPDLFYNYYVPNNSGAAAAAYPAPYPTPNLIGHTYYTYQPLMPHEFLYTHQRSYHQAYDGGRGLNRTSVRWYRTPARTAFKDFGGSVGWFLGNIHR